jgi:hypothetical protein
LIDETVTARAVTNRFEVLIIEEGIDETTVVRGKNQGKHKRRAMKRAAERATQQEAQTKRGRIDYGFVSDFRQRRRQFNIENDESAHNRLMPPQAPHAVLSRRIHFVLSVTAHPPIACEARTVCPLTYSMDRFEEALAPIKAQGCQKGSQTDSDS